MGIRGDKKEGVMGRKGDGEAGYGEEGVMGRRSVEAEG